MVAFYGTGLDKDPSIAIFHKQLKKHVQSTLFNLGEQLERRLKTDLQALLDNGKLKCDKSKQLVMSFEDFCSLSTLAVKYSVLRVNAQESTWDTQRRKLIRKKKGQKMKWIETEISNDYAQFVVAQSLAETSYFEEANEVCYRFLELTTE